MVKDSEEQKPLVPIVARMIAKLVENNDKARVILAPEGGHRVMTRFLVAASSRQGNHCIPCTESAGSQCG